MQQFQLILLFQALFGWNILSEINSRLEIFFFNLGILNFKLLINLRYSHNLNVETDFLIAAAIQILTRKLKRETPIALIVMEKALNLLSFIPLINIRFVFDLILFINLRIYSEYQLFNVGLA